MKEKTLLASGSPITQRIDAVKSLLAWKKVSCDPLPQEVSLDSGRLVLVLSKKKDCYYVTTAHACSCPAATYHHGPCKHQKKYFPQEEENLRDSLPGWPGGLNGPVEVI
ncbi:MAG: hypothetical protein BWZ03_00866 [bacterium ADurb.BinA186]|nr:MAG: hypothetical protein BWZ03_00866 [bacterium ADurb.BinA186]